MPQHPCILPWQHNVGVGAALAFAVFLSIASLIINTKLKGKEKPNTVSLYLFLGVVAVDLPFLFTLADPAGIVTHHALNSADTFMFLGVGFIFYGFQFLRSWALLISNNASVVNLLYAEIAFAFLWGQTVLHQPFFWSSASGALLIIVGCLVVSHLKRRSAQPSPALVTVQDPPVSDGKLIDVSDPDSICSTAGAWHAPSNSSSSASSSNHQLASSNSV